MLNMTGKAGQDWREFERNGVTHSAAHYLMAIDRLRTEFGYARATDVAERLAVSRGAASMALSQLKRRRWVKEDPHRFLLLTEEGQKVVNEVSESFGILARFFEEVLGVSPRVAQRDACKMEHLLGLETRRRLMRAMRFILAEESARGREPGEQIGAVGRLGAWRRKSRRVSTANAGIGRKGARHE